MTAPKATPRDYAWTALAILLASTWLNGVLGGLDRLIEYKDLWALVAATVATLGYMLALQWIMGRSQYVTYLWMRHLMRREFVES